jgi:acyl carrier protein
MPSSLRLQNVFRDVFDDDTFSLHPDLSQENCAEWDSLRQFRLVMALEEEFQTKLSTEQAVSLTSVARIEAFLESQGLC